MGPFAMSPSHIAVDDTVTELGTSPTFHIQSRCGAASSDRVISAAVASTKCECRRVRLCRPEALQLRMRKGDMTPLPGAYSETMKDTVKHGRA